MKALPHFARDCCKYDNPQRYNIYLTSRSWGKTEVPLPMYDHSLLTVKKFRLNNFQEQYLKTSGNYLQSYKYFHPYRNEITEILKCSDKVMKNVTKRAKSLFK